MIFSRLSVSLKPTVNSILETETLLRSSKPILSLAVSKDESLLAISGFSYVVIVDLERREVVSKITRVSGRILALEWGPKGSRLLALGRANGDVFTWDIGKGSLVGYQRATSPIRRIVFHPSGRSLFVAERDGRISLWRLRDKESEQDSRSEVSQSLQATDIGTVPGRITDFWMSALGEYLMASSNDGSIYRFVVRGAQMLDKIASRDNSLNSTVVFPLTNLDKFGARTLIVAVGGSGKLSFWCSDGRELFSSSSRSSTVDRLKGVEGSSILWGVQKTGNLVILLGGMMSEEGRIGDLISLCPSVKNLRT